MHMWCSLVWTRSNWYVEFFYMYLDLVLNLPDEIPMF